MIIFSLKSKISGFAGHLSAENALIRYFSAFPTEKRPANPEIVKNHKNLNFSNISASNPSKNICTHIALGKFSKIDPVLPTPNEQ